MPRDIILFNTHVVRMKYKIKLKIKTSNRVKMYTINNELQKLLSKDDNILYLLYFFILMSRSLLDLTSLDNGM